jgi:PAS domain S-box-containing protein
VNSSAVADIQKEVSCRVTNSVIKYLESKGYSCDSIIKNLPQSYSKEFLTDPHNWVTYETRQMLCRRAAELTKDNAFMFQVGLATPQLNPLGGVESMVRLLTGPKMVYKLIPRYAAFFDRVSRFKTANISPNKVAVEMSMNGDHSPSKDSCYYTQGILAAIPTLWGLPPATVREKKCMCPVDPKNIQDGVQYEAATCEFEVEWQPLYTSPRRWLDNLFSRIFPISNDVKELEESFRQVDQKNAELVARNRQLAAVREIAISIDNVRTIDETLSLAVEQAREIEGVQFVLVQKMDKTKKYVITPYYSKIRPEFKYMANAVKALGFDIEKELGESPTSNKLRFPLSKLKVALDYNRNPRIMVIPTLAELLDGVWPRMLCNAIQKIMGVKKFVIVPIMVEGESWGHILYFLSRDIPLDILEMIGAHCALAIKNIGHIEALANEAIWRRILIDQSLDGIVVLDEQAKVYEANQRFAEMLGYSPEEVRELHTWDWDVKWKPEQLLEMGRLVDSSGLHLETQHRRKDGTIFDVDISINGATCAEQKLIFCVCRDVTERKRMEESIRYHANLVENVSDAIISSDKNYKLLSWNKAAEEMYGWREEEVIGKTVMEVTKPVFVNITQEEIQKLLRQNGAWKGEAIHQRKDGGELYVLISISVIKDEQGNEQGAVTTFKDITDRKRIEEALKESEERFSKAFHATPDAISISNLDNGEFIEVNDSYVKASGYSREELIGKNATVLNMWANEEQREQMNQNIHDRVKLHNEEYQFRTKSGELRAKLISTEYITLGGELCLLVVSTDIAELKKAEEALIASEQKFSAAFRSSPNAICLVSVEGQFIEVNESFTRFTGYTREEIIGQRAADMGFWLSKADTKRMDTKLRKTGSLHNEEFASRMKSGEVRIGLFSAETIDIEGKGIAVMVITDITERRRAQEALKVSEENIRVQKELIERVLATIPNAVFLLDKDLQILMANQSVYRIFKIRTTKNKYERITKALKATELNRIITNMVRRGEQSTRTELRYMIAGRERILRADVFIMPNDEILLAINDITDESEKQERLYLTDRLVSIGEMASGVAHELNNPLTSVIGLASLLLQQDISPIIKEDVQAIYSEAQRCASIVKNLLTFARKHVSKKEPLQIAKIVADVLKLRGYELRVNNITVETDFPADFPEVSADNFEMQQVFINLVLNAEAAMIGAHGRGTLKIAGRVVDGKAVISFADDGPGITPENMRYIFNPFFTTKEVGKGTGLGLSICYGIIASHGGKIYAKSEPGEGATFIIELPTNNETERLDK